jgi:DNA-binding transcriptional LysR family regulator
MRLELLQEYIVFSQYLNYSKAAQALNLTQSALSTHIIRLEKELGFELVKRGKRITLTPAGEVFLSAAQSITESYQSAVAKCIKLVKGTGSIVRVFNGDKLGSPFRDLVSLPDTPISWVSSNNHETIFELFDRDLIDVTIWGDFRGSEDISREIENHNLAYVEFVTTDCYLCLSCDHPLVNKESIAASDLEQYPIKIVNRENYEVWKHVIQRMIGQSKNLMFRINTREFFQDFLEIDPHNSIFFLTEGQLDLYLSNNKSIIIRDEIDGRRLSIKLLLIFKKDMNETVRSFLTQIFQSIEKMT